jgi:PAS domain S-box-containing protein
VPPTSGSHLQRAARALGALVLALGAVVVLGRILGHALLASALPEAPMQMNAALAVIALGASLYWSAHAATQPRRARILALVALLIAALTLFQYLSGVALGIDELVTKERWDDAASLPPGRMAPNTALGLCLVALALLTIDRRRDGFATPAQLLSLVTLTIAGFSLVDRLFLVGSGSTLSSIRQMSGYGAVSLAALSIGVVCTRPDDGLMKTVRARGPGGETARRLLPLMVLVPVALGWIRTRGEQAALYDTAFGASIMTVSMTLLFAGVVLWNARNLDRLYHAQRRAERQRTRAEAEIKASHRFLDAVIENLPAMVFIKDAERLAFTRINRAGEQLLGIARAEMLGKSDYDFFPEDEARFFQAKDRETLQAKKLVDIVEEPIETRSGRRWLSTKKVPILDQHGNPTHLLGISEDITARRAAEEALRSAKEAAEAANRELATFSYSVSHDLRSPLRSIDGFSQALLDDCATVLTPECRSHLTRIRMAASRMGQLIDDLLELSRVNRAELRVTTVDVSSVAREIASELGRAAPERSVDFRIEPELTLHGDARLLRIALENLLGNAFKFTSKRESARIELCRGEWANGRRSFLVRDNGAGFDMNYAQKLFDPFQRLHAATEFEGTGIGLATVQRILHRHGGTISARAAVGEGATFFVTLPERAELK